MTLIGETKREFSGRMAWERKFSRMIGELHMRELNALLRSFGDRIAFDSIPSEYWQEYNREWIGIAQPTLEATAMAAAEEAVAELPIGVDWALINTDASSWARSYGYDLVKGITDKTRAALQQILPDFYTQGWTLGDLRTRLTPLFGPVRAEMIATTEITRAAVEGERIVVRHIVNENGLRFTEFWQTSNDERVCPVCGPRNGKPEGAGWTRASGPPAHPRCRCWTTHRLERPA